MPGQFPDFHWGGHVSMYQNDAEFAGAASQQEWCPHFFRLGFVFNIEGLVIRLEFIDTESFQQMNDSAFYPKAG